MKHVNVHSKVPSRALGHRPAGEGLAVPLVVNVLAARLEGEGVSRLRVALPTGRSWLIGEPRAEVPVPVVMLNRLRVLARGWSAGLMGWAEGYMAGDWSCDRLVDMTDWAMANEAALERAFAPGRISTLLNRLYHRLHANSRTGSRRNIAYHYDLGNEFYRLWLDPTMTYSAALFGSAEEPLEQAQLRKYRRVLQLLDPQPGQRVLEIGCGWGGFGEVLLKGTDCHWRGVTLSAEQLAWTRARLSPFGGRARSSLTDYRDLNQTVDQIVSIEMLEAVGEENWPTYFSLIKRLLKPGGRAVIQVITIDDQRFDSYRRNTDFIQRYIFPGGMLPCPRVMREQIANAGLELMQEEGFGADYARTLAHWRTAFQDAWPQIEAQGFDRRFYRMWSYYLAYCESGFRAGSIDVRFYQLCNAASGESQVDSPP